jgi:hypothetical protein
MKKFLISIDTEGDDLWSWKPGQEISTENAKYLPRFQNLCEKYGFKPTYLTNYEMALSPEFQRFAKAHLVDNSCEVGMHLHAWNSPPLAELPKAENSNSPYLIEYAPEVMEAKIAYITRLLQDEFQTEILSHRAGRWATNQTYFDLLSKYGYRVDCSVTPGMNWSHNPGQSPNSSGSDYSGAPTAPYFPAENLVELPVTIRKRRDIFQSKSPVGMIYRARHPNMVWLRPRGNNLRQMLWLVETIGAEKGTDYIMFMLHSSEMMPGGSPNFKTPEDIESMYKDLEKVFNLASKVFEGAAIGEFGTEFLNTQR